jgi:hypothetical protein
LATTSTGTPSASAVTALMARSRTQEVASVRSAGTSQKTCWTV